MRQIPRSGAIEGVKRASALRWPGPSTLRPIRYRRFSQTWGCYPTFDKVKDFPPLPATGEPVVFATDLKGNPVGEAKLLPSGEVAIKTCINDGTGSLWGAGRKDFESFLPLGGFLGLAGHARAHAAGQGTGPESPYGIAFARTAINEFQNKGVEEDIRQLAGQAGRFPFDLATNCILS